MKILLTGCNGFLGNNIHKKLTEKKYNLTATSRQVLDLTCTEHCSEFFRNRYFDIVIHCAISGGKRLVLDSESIIEHNLRMASNLLINKNSFGKLIHFGSGAELDRNTNIDEKSVFLNCSPKDYYGFSKNIICRLFAQEKNFYNLRIFNVFDSKEFEGRMITSNIKNYINKKPIIIHQDKFMDFMYFDDFYKILLHFLENQSETREIDCVYKNKYKLSDIADIINNLDTYKVAINIEKEGLGNSYTGKFHHHDSNFIGLYEGIQQVYKDIKNEKFTY